jgi:hypothetical protein
MKGVGRAELVVEERCVASECDGRADTFVRKVPEQSWQPIDGNQPVNTTAASFTFQRGNIRLVGQFVVVS